MRDQARYLLLTLSISLFITGAGATYLTVEGPVSTLLYNNGSIYLGKVAPGESFYVLASPTTANQSGLIVNIGWDTLITTGMPPGWTSQASLLYENPMKMKVTVAPNASTGTYKLTVRAVNIQNYSKLGNLTFTAYVNVTPNVYRIGASPSTLVAGVGQPVNIKVIINNTSISDDPFLLNAAGLPAWNVPVQVISTHNTTTTYLYPVFVDVPGVYSFNLTVNSTTSQLLHRSFPTTLTSQASLFNDYSATGQGVVLSPIIYEPAYAIMLLISDVYHLVFK